MMQSPESGSQLLFVDDEKPFQQYITENLAGHGYEIITADYWQQAKNLISGQDIRPEIVFLDPASPKNRRLDLQQVCWEVNEIPLVVVSSARDPQEIVQAIRLGATNYLCKPVEIDCLFRVIREIIDRKARRGQGASPARKSATSAADFIFCNPQMQQVYETILQLAHADVPVLLQGESGVGKDVVARTIQRNSTLRNRAFVKVNCAALPVELVESELFGHDKGAFTGASTPRVGKFEFANGGTIFLDEISEFTPSVQAKLLQVLQDKRFSPLGSNREIEIDVRVIAATNRKLEDAIEKGLFREDLYYRLNVINIEIPPLRHRKDEIRLLCRHFLDKFRDKLACDVRELPEALYRLFDSYHWPGNIRELENMVKRYLVLQRIEPVQMEIEAKISRRSVDEVDQLAERYLEENGDNLDLKEIARKATLKVERSMIRRALQRSSWNRVEAAKELKVSYKTLLTKIEQLDIRPSAA